MKFSCEKTLLQNAISIASRAVAPKSSIPALEGILVEAGDMLRLTGYNLETGIRTLVDAEIEEGGWLVLSSRLFGDIVRKLPDDVVYFRSEGHTVHITCGMSEFHIQAVEEDFYPELPEVEENADHFALPRNLLSSMIRETVFACSTNESRMIHNGCLFEVEGDVLTVVGVDGYRLGIRRETLTEKTGEDFSFVIHRVPLAEVEKIAGESEEPVTISQGMMHVLFEMGNTMVVSRRLEGNFLDYKKAVPRKNPIVVEGDTKELLASIERVSLIISDRLKSPLRCSFLDGMLHLTTKTAIGNANDQCPIVGDGGGLEIGFNNRYIMDALKNAPAERVKIELSSDVTPCIIVPAEGEEHFVFMVLPVRLRGEG